KARSGEIAPPCRRDHGWQRPVGSTQTPAPGGGTPGGDPDGPFDDRNVRAVKDRGVDALRFFGRELATAQNGNRFSHAAVARVSAHRDAVDSTEQHSNEVPGAFARAATGRAAGHAER